MCNDDNFPRSYSIEPIGYVITFEKLAVLTVSILAAIDTALADSGALVGLVFLVEPSLYAFLSPVVGLYSDKAKYPMLLLVIEN